MSKMKTYPSFMQPPEIEKSTSRSYRCSGSCMNVDEMQNPLMERPLRESGGWVSTMSQNSPRQSEMRVSENPFKRTTFEKINRLYSTRH
jgi:hypothetical protein